MIRDVIARSGWEDRFQPGPVKVLIYVNELFDPLDRNEREWRTSGGKAQLHVVATRQTLFKVLIEHSLSSVWVSRTPPNVLQQRPRATGVICKQDRTAGSAACSGSAWVIEPAARSEVIGPGEVGDHYSNALKPQLSKERYKAVDNERTRDDRRKKPR